MDEQPLSKADARNLRFLRGLVLVLTTTMILGMVTLLGLFYVRFSGNDAEVSGAVTLPEGFDLPAGEEITAVTQAKGFWVVVTGAGEVLFYSPSGGAPMRRVSPN